MDASGTIVIAGEALIDLVGRDGGDLRPHAGGGPFNAARAAARLGTPVTYLGRLSSDRFGEALRAALAADGVGLGAVVATAEPTTLALAEVTADGSATYRFYVDGTSAPGLTEDDVAGVLPSAPSMLCVGTLGLVFEPSAQTLERLVAAAGDGVLVAVDPNIRPAAIADEAAYRARLERILARADLVKASEDDLAWLHPGAGPAEAMRRILAVADGDGGGGARAGVVTLGPDGALVVPLSGEAVAVSAPPVQVVDTIGAGDAFLGGLLSWWHRAGLGRSDLADTAQVIDAARFACHVAAVTCGRAGADPPHLSDL
ncbi:MAG TPA: carbohydrate kinase [Baekduia sp.]|jgi:fructokinase|nr:carbohydrate kinase [Baekduia sp.]